MSVHRFHILLTFNEIIDFQPIDKFSVTITYKTES